MIHVGPFGAAPTRAPSGAHITAEWWPLRPRKWRSARRGAKTNGIACTRSARHLFSTCTTRRTDPGRASRSGAPDDRDPANRPLLAVADGELAGTLRLDMKGRGWPWSAWWRWSPPSAAAASAPPPFDMAEDLGRASVCARSLCVNAQPGVVGFDARRGFAPRRWEGCTACPRGIPMVKALAGRTADARRRAA